MKKFSQLVKTNENMEITEELQAIPEGESQEAELETSADATTAVAEVETEGETGEEIIEGIADAEKAVFDLEALSEVVSEAEVDGGLTPIEAQAVEVTHESIMKSLGLSHRHGDLIKPPVYEPSNYALNSAMRLTATKMTNENLESSAKTVVNMLSIGIQKLLEMIGNIAAKIMEFAKRYEMMLSLLERQVNAIPSNAQLANAVSEDTDLIRELTVNGQAGPESIMIALNAAQQFIMAASNDIAHYTAALSAKKSVDTEEIVKRMNNVAKIGEKLSGARRIYYRPDDRRFGIDATRIASEAKLATKDQMLSIIREARKLDRALVGVRERLSQARATLSGVVKSDVSGGHTSQTERELTQAIFTLANNMSMETNRQIAAAMKLVRASLAQYGAKPITSTPQQS